MSSEGIRLRLTIRRHALPEVNLVWPCVAANDFTVANLLSQINEVVTLESGQWGLEDYAVELADSNGASFECLHFQQVRQVFKQDDQVLWVLLYDFPNDMPLLILMSGSVPFSPKTSDADELVGDTRSLAMGYTWSTGSPSDAEELRKIGRC